MKENDGRWLGAARETAIFENAHLYRASVSTFYTPISYRPTALDRFLHEPKSRYFFFIVVVVIVVRLYYCSASTVRINEGTVLKSETFMDVGSLSNTSAVPFSPLHSNRRTNVFRKPTAVATEFVKTVVCYFTIQIICILIVRKK